MTYISITEQESNHNHLEQKSVHEILTGINKEDQTVALAVEKTIPDIERLVTGIVERMRRGGRLFYLGAGTSGRLGVLDASEIPPSAREKGILTAAISCNPGSPVSEAAEIKIEPVVGPEYVTGSTRMKSGTAQKMVLNMITTATMIRLGRVKGNRMVNMQLTNQKLVDRGTRMIVDELSLNYEQAKNLLLLHGSVRKAIEQFNNGA